MRRGSARGGSVDEEGLGVVDNVRRGGTVG
uniref:Uncharacterized protein n=2 Tax=Bartonella schoenbuchensis TaxID=165694 RepID=E6Z1C1_BARSR|nr:hypothetical protein BARSC_190182 [Bartonella schoenbuchensis R1]